MYAKNCMLERQLYEYCACSIAAENVKFLCRRTNSQNRLKMTERVPSNMQAFERKFLRKI